MIELSHTYERYSQEVGGFIPAELRVITLLNLIGVDAMPVEDEKQVFVDMGYCDIDVTLIRAFQNLNRMYPECFVRVYDAPKQLGKIIAADIGVQLIVDTDILPINPPKSSAWKDEFIPEALSLGCAGVIAHDIKPEVIADFPHALFLRRAAE